jgi:hypothetical protein
MTFNLLKSFLVQNNLFPFLNMISSGRIVVTLFEPGDPRIFPHFATLEQYHRVGLCFPPSLPPTDPSLPHLTSPLSVCPVSPSQLLTHHPPLWLRSSGGFMARLSSELMTPVRGISSLMS